MVANPNANQIRLSSEAYDNLSSGQVKIAVTNTAIVLGTATKLFNGVTIKANSANSAAITVGVSTVTNTVDGTGNGFKLAAGESVSVAISNLSFIFVNGTSGDWVSFIGN